MEKKLKMFFKQGNPSDTEVHICGQSEEFASRLVDQKIFVFDSVLLSLVVGMTY